MPAELKSDSNLEIAHILFIDIVGYSKLLMNEQSEVLQQLNQAVRSTEQFRTAEAAGKLIRIPVGDGMALVFFNTPEAPVRAAVEISEALRDHPQIRLRMGIHSGPVNEVLDVNDRSNVAGAGINMAQRVMECGDAGHILLSKRVADDLAPFGHWRSQLHDLGDCEVKHGESVFLVNFYDDKIGNRQLPRKLRRARQEAIGAVAPEPARASDKRNQVRLLLLLLGGFVLVLGALFFLYTKTPKSESRSAATPSRVAPVPEKSIAVLPFENLSKDEENAFFAGGVQDDILTSLAKISDLKVISRTSVMQYRGVGAARNLREIARALGVESILEGSVRRVGNRVLVNVQLIDARNDHHIWAERYDRTVSDSIGLQGELAVQIASALRARLAPEEQARLEAKPTDNPGAYALYLRALGHERALNHSTEDAIAAEHLYAEAIALDPKFALARARLSIVNSYLAGGPSDNRALRAKARSAAEEALRLSPSLAEAHMALGLCLYWAEKDYAAALKEFSIAEKTSPNEPDILQYIAGIYRRQGRWGESLATYERAQALDPRNLEVSTRAALDHVLVREWAAATACYNRALEIASDSADARIGLAYLEVFRNANPAAGRKILQKIPAGIDPDGRVTSARWDLAMIERDYAVAEKILKDFPLEDFSHAGDAPKTYYMGRVALARGDVEAQRYFAATTPAIEGWVRDEPDDPGRHAQLGLLYAYMRRKEDAIREGRRAVELEPESQNAFHGANTAANLALVYALVGEPDEAITLIERLLSIPGPVGWPDFPQNMTLADLRLRWEWDQLRSDPRFQKILTAPEPKTVY